MANERDMEILREMISEDALVELARNPYGKAIVQLEERQQPDSMVEIKNPPADAIVIKIDQFKSPDTLFACKHNECKRADFVIISAEKECILYIEMKLSSGKASEVTQQLQGAQCVVQYCKAIGKSFWEEEGFLEGYQDRYISFRKTGRKKRRRHDDYGGRQPCDTPENAMRIASPHNIQFGQLVGKK